jgi:hypothetical protein
MEAQMIDAGGAFWILITVIGAVILALGLFYASQQAKNAPRDPETLRLKREATEENFSAAAVEEKPIFARTAPEKTSKPKERRPRIGKSHRTRRSAPRPSTHASS